MFDDIFDAVKGKFDEISTSVDDRIKEARDNRSRNGTDSDQKSGLFGSFIELVDEANDTISKLLTEDKVAGPLQIGAPPTGSLKPRSSITRDSNGAGSSRSNLESDDDMYGYNLTDDESEDEEGDDSVGDMPKIRSHLKGSDPNSPSVDKKLNLSDLGGEPLPRYGLPSVYLKPSEVCQRRVTTTRRITEADLDENSPLYRHRDQILGAETQKKVATADSKSGKHSHSKKNGLHVKSTIPTVNVKPAIPTVQLEGDTFHNDGPPRWSSSRTKYNLAREVIMSPRAVRKSPKSSNSHNVVLNCFSRWLTCLVDHIEDHFVEARRLYNDRRKR